MKTLLKTPEIPIWVTIFALIVFVMGCSLGVMGAFGAFEGMDGPMSISWGGRTVGLGLAAGVAVLLKSPIAYIAAFVGGMGRELGDLLGELNRAEPDIGVVAFIVVFLIAGTLGIIAANKARNL